MLSTPHIETWEQHLFSLISTYGVLISRDSFSVGYEKHLGEFEATLGGEDQTAVVEGDRPPQHRRPIPPQVRDVDDGVGVVLDHDPDLRFSISGR